MDKIILLELCFNSLFFTIWCAVVWHFLQCFILFWNFSVKQSSCQPFTQSSSPIFSQSYHQWILRKVLKPRSDISSVIAFSVFIPKNLANLSVVSLAFKQLFIFKSLSSIILNLDSDRQTDRRRNIKKYQAIWSVCKWFQYSLSQKKYGIYSMGGTDKIQTGVKTKNASIN